MLAMSTDYKDSVPSINRIEEYLSKISSSGISHIHWCHDWEGDYIYSDSEMEQIKELMAKYNLKGKAVHATDGNIVTSVNEDGYKITAKVRNTDYNRRDITSLNEYNRLAGVELIKNRVDLASRISTSEIVLHMLVPYKSFEKSTELEEKYWEQAFKSFDELEPYCKEKRVKIAIENMIWIPLEVQKSQLDRLFERYDKDFMGFCFDSGHGAIMNINNPLEMLERYKERLIAMHLNDNDGCDENLLEDDVAVKLSDKHRLPYDGIIDWQKLTKLIAESPYKMPLTLEVAIAQGIEDEVFLKKALEVGNKLTKMVNNHNKN